MFMRNQLLLLFFFSALFSHAQSSPQNKASEENNLHSIYRQWMNASSGKGNIASDPEARMATSLFYPAKATNYTWNTLSSNWSFLDTTLYEYAGPGLVSSATLKNSMNIFLVRTLTAYDTADRVIETIYQTWSTGWLNNYRDTFVFDSYNELIRHEHKTWSGSAWTTVAGDNFQNTYSGTGKILDQIAQTWNGTAWQNAQHFIHTYNAMDQDSQTIRESWNVSVWAPTSKTNYFYNASDTNIQAIDYWWQGSTWVNNAQIINAVWAVWTGDISTSKPASYTYQTWSGSAWVNAQRLLSATYDSFGGSVETFQQFISGNWVNDVRNSDFFDMQYNKTGERNETWNMAFAVWDTTYEFRYLFTYDVNNSITESIYQQYDISTSVYVNYTKTVYSDFLFMNLPEITREENFSVTIFPNPVTDFADVIIVFENFNPVAYQVYDLNGRRIFVEESRSKNFRLHKNNLHSGIYFLLVSDAAGETVSVKFIVQ